MSSITNWIAADSSKLCPVLRDKIIDSYYVQRWVPNFFFSTVRYLRHTLQKLPIIVEIDEDHYFKVLNNDNLGGILGCHINHRYKTFNGFSAKVNINTIKRLINNVAVKKIWYDRDIKACLDVAAPSINAPYAWKSNVKGSGIGIAILDTGIYRHPDLTRPFNRIIKFKDFVNHYSQPYDDNGHGTHCAGAAAGNGKLSKGRFIGAAPMANLIGVKVLNKKGNGKMSVLLAGIEWCIKNKKKYGINIISLSLGSKAIEHYKNDPICRAVKRAWKSGIVVCAAAGNEGPAARTINSPGIEPEIITVGAVDDRGTPNIIDDKIPHFSSRGPTIDGLPKPDLVAPGVNITSLKSPGSLIDTLKRKKGITKYYSSLSGTSMATPICAGAAALLLENNPSLNPGEVKKVLLKTCRKINSYPNIQGAGILDIKSALSYR